MSCGSQTSSFAPARLVLVALGSNLGDSPALIREAMDRLEELGESGFLRSSLWQSAPVDCPPGSPPFINAAVAFQPGNAETPESLLAKLQDLETEFGRRPKLVLNEPRPLDLDLIAFGAELRSSPQLTLPHPRAHLRRFVLEPLNEIAREFVLPGQGKSISRWLAEFSGSEAVSKL